MCSSDLHHVSVAFPPAETESASSNSSKKKKKKKNKESSTTGFYVRMKLHHHQHKHIWPLPFTTTPALWHRGFKYLLWFSVSLYLLFSSSFILHQNVSSNPLSRHTNQAPSRALFESNSAASLVKPVVRDCLNGLKVYVYDLPAKYNSDWLTNERCQRHLFGAEVAIHRALLISEVRTLDPNEADYFFVPVYVACNFSTVNGFPAIGHARGLISSAIDRISSELPFWNRSGGSDHVFAATHDFGSCFHTLEDVAIADGVPAFLKNSVILQTFGVNYNHPCQDVENVVIPPYVQPESVRLTLENHPLDGERDIFAFFRGKMEIHPKNVSGRFYSKAVRTKIWNYYSNDRRFYLKRQRYAGYQTEIARSVFCLCPLGWAPWSPRLVESVALGCVPVVIADGIRLPFMDTVPWRDISLTVAEKDVGKLGRILYRVARTNLSDIQRNLRDPAVRKALMFNVPAQEGDATWQVLSSLAQKLGRRSRSGRASEGGVHSE